MAKSRNEFKWTKQHRDQFEDLKQALTTAPVLATLDPVNYPFGKKDLIREGDCPVIWTNTKYKMLYLNMGHGDQVVSNPMQNRMFANAILWVGMKK